MTGEKNRGVSLEKLWKIDDKDLSTPEHDELVIMLLDHEYLEKMFSDNFDLINIKIVNVQSEVPLTQGYNHFVFGFVDVVATITCSEDNNTNLKCPHCGDVKTYGKEIVIEAIDKKTVATCRGCNKTFVVTSELTSTSIYNETKKFYIECKPMIYSFGETLRQIQLYKTATPKDSYFILFTPDTKFKKQFESQNITVITP